MAARPGARVSTDLIERILRFGRAEIGRRAECANIATRVGIRQYVGIASEVAATLERTAATRILDWGAGWGQTSLLLWAHGFEVVAYDVEDKGAATGLLTGTGVPYVVTAGPGLPFPDGEFAAVLNCGVLEHVDDPDRTLGELRRVLRPEGWLFTYHLPNRHAWVEWLGRRLGRFHHDRTYARPEAVALFENAGFRVLQCRPFHVLPRNIWARWPALGAATVPWAIAYERLDDALVRLPVVGRFATAWALLARRVG